MNEKIVSLETLVEETGKTGNSSLQDTLLNEIRQTKVEIQNQTKLIADSANEVQKAILGELIKNQLNEMQLDSVNYLKQESELLTSFITENLDVQTKEISDDNQRFYHMSIPASCHCFSLVPIYFYSTNLRSPAQLSTAREITGQPGLEGSPCIGILFITSSYL